MPYRATVGEALRGSQTEEWGIGVEELGLLVVLSPSSMKDQASFRHGDALGPSQGWTDEERTVIRAQPEEGSQGPREGGPGTSIEV